MIAETIAVPIELVVAGGTLVGGATLALLGASLRLLLKVSNNLSNLEARVTAHDRLFAVLVALLAQAVPGIDPDLLGGLADLEHLDQAS